MTGATSTYSIPEVVDSPSLRVIGCPHPCSIKRVDVTMPAGSTITQAMLHAGLPTHLPARVFVNDILVDRVLWGLWTPEPGDVLTVRIIPTGGGGGGGGKNPLRTILMLAVMVAVIYFSPYLSQFIAPSLFSAAGQALGLGGMLLQAAVGGSLAVNALIPSRRVCGHGERIEGPRS